MMRCLELYPYNPDQQSDEELEATFVARESVLGSILDDFRAGADSPSNQHFLITGPRGIGKTMLLIMIRRRVAKDAELARAYLPIKTAEEEYSISSLRDFFTRVIELLLEAVEDEALDAALAALKGTDDDDQGVDLAVEALKAFRQRDGRKLLLLWDNLDLILDEQMTDDAQLGRLRDVLMNDSFLVLVGTAPSHFSEVSGYDRPFYHFFRPIDLGELTADQSAELLHKRAEVEENQTMLDRFDELRPRLQAIHHLTGGNPRLALMLYQLYTRTELPEVRGSIKTLLDDVTPYYKHRLESLSPQQRKVMDTFARLGQPATPTELAGEVRLGVTQINSILKRLRDLGFVSVAPQKRRKSTLYLVADRVFRIWHQMRYSTASRRRVEFLIEFLQIWYTESEWKDEAGRLLGEYRATAEAQRFDEAGRYIEHLEYLTAAAPKREWGDEVAEDMVVACIESGDLDRAEELLEERVREQTRANDEDSLAQSWFRRAHLRNAQGNIEQEIAALEQAVQHKSDFHEALSAWAAALVDLAETKSGAAREELLLRACDKYQVALEAKPEKREALYDWGNALSDLAVVKSGAVREELLEQACEKYEAVVEVKADEPDALNNWGGTLGRLAEAKSGAAREGLLEQACDKFQAAVGVRPDMHEALYNWGIALTNLAGAKSGAAREGLLEQACEKYQAAVEVKPDKYTALCNWGIALSDLAGAKSGAAREGLLEQACEKCQAAVEVKPDEHEALYSWGVVLSRLAETRSGGAREGLLKQACEKYRATVAVKPDKHGALYNWGNALGDLAETKSGAAREDLLGQACEKYRAAVEVKPDKREALNNWGAGLASLAEMKEGAERDRHWESAQEKVALAVEVAATQGDKKGVAFCSAHLVRIALLRCAAAVEAENRGTAREHFEVALEHWGQADRRKAWPTLFEFFSNALREQAAEICDELFGVMKERQMEEEVGVLTPFVAATAYWVKGKDAELLDRLNPEMRELVEAIIEGKRLGIEVKESGGDDGGIGN